MDATGGRKRRVFIALGSGVCFTLNFKVVYIRFSTKPERENLLPFFVLLM